MNSNVALAPARVDTLRQVAEARAPEMIAFAQRLIQTPSMPGDERAVVELSANELRKLGYDDVWIDRAGNVIGVFRGSGYGPTVQFNGHVDHVSPGDHSLWSRDPYGGEIADGVLYGRGASDVKGAFAAQVYLGAVLREIEIRPAGDVFVAGVVLEEVGGFGSRLLAEEMPTDFAVLCEATNNQLNRGHRGRAFVNVTFRGLSTHASAPERGRNPHFAAARFLLMIEQLDMVKHPTFGASTAAPTRFETDQTSGNVTPGMVSVYLDWRNVPTEPPEKILERLRPLVQRVEQECDGVSGSIELVGREVTTYTGLSDVMPTTNGFETPADHPVVVTARDSLQAVLKRDVEVGTWTFATDGGHLARAGITTIGFAAGEERYAHTIHDQIDLGKLRESLAGNAALALDLTDLPKEDEG